MNLKIRSFWPAGIWFILSTIVFCLPGSSLPKEEWFELIQLDKWIHVVIFMVMVLLWCLPLFHRVSLKSSPLKLFVGISIGLSGYGILIECIQHFLISNRSFDLGDIAADAMGCLIGFILVKRQWKK